MMAEKIVRRWEARAPESAVQEWLDGFRKLMLPKMLSTEGFLSVSIHVSRGEDPRHIAVFTTWDSKDALVRFAGPDLDVAVIPDWVAAIIPDHDTHATHYDEVLFELN
jgi:heme-degrading monooxygenase HmoA